MAEKKVRIGIVGTGNMGSAHARAIQEGKIPGAELTAVHSLEPEGLERFAPAEIFDDHTKLLDSGLADAVIIATPHYQHTTIGIEALKKGFHVLVEKPISVHKADAEKLVAAAKPRRKQVFAAMFNQRTDPHYIKLRELIRSGELGELVRVNWIITSWFRSQAYYDSGGWRATWAGEGGGVLMNQCPHQLDLLQWLCGMPRRVRAFCHLGKFHDIEVEDEVTAYLEYPNGATGVSITSTGEAPGTNRLEIAGTRGKVVAEGKSGLTFTRNEIPADVYCRETDNKFGRPPVWNVEIPVAGHGGQHVEVLNNFVDAIRKGTPLIAPAVEGIHSVELDNAMMLSSLTGKTVELPLNPASFTRKLNQLIAASRPRRKKPARKAGVTDMSKSFA